MCGTTSAFSQPLLAFGDKSTLFLSLSLIFQENPILRSATLHTSTLAKRSEHRRWGAHRTRDGTQRTLGEGQTGEHAHVRTRRWHPSYQGSTKHSPACNGTFEERGRVALRLFSEGSMKVVAAESWLERATLLQLECVPDSCRL